MNTRSGNTKIPSWATHYILGENFKIDLNNPSKLALRFLKWCGLIVKEYNKREWL